jgi:hypothetical protein
MLLNCLSTTKPNKGAVMTTISIAPDRAQHARICAYILAMQADLSPYEFGDYWNYTEAQEELIFRAYKDWDTYCDFWIGVGVEMVDVPKSHRIKAVKACIARAKGDQS